MRCSNCQKVFHGNGMLLTTDGDFACGQKCNDEWNRKKDHFLNTVISDDRLYGEWERGEDFPK